MNPQPTLFDAAYRVRGPATSREAADALNERQAAHTLAMDALAFVRERGAHGATFDEWAADRGHPSSQSGRFTSLLAAGLIVPSGQRRPSRSGHQCRVYVAKESA